MADVLGRRPVAPEVPTLDVDVGADHDAPVRGEYDGAVVTGPEGDGAVLGARDGVRDPVDQTELAELAKARPVAGGGLLLHGGHPTNAGRGGGASRMGASHISEHGWRTARVPKTPDDEVDDEYDDVDEYDEDEDLDDDSADFDDDSEDEQPAAVATPPVRQRRRAAARPAGPPSHD